MLQNLHVKNLALIDECEVEFDEGLNILSGETGAGKSIIIGSINLALGEKVPKEMLRDNGQSAFVELIFSVENEDTIKKLRELDIKIGYASGRSMQGIERTMNATFLGKYCDGICAGSEVPSKPDPTMMHILCKRLKVEESRVLGVGDSGLDIKMYQNAGCFSLGVQTGVWSGDALTKLKPNILLKGVGDLTAYFN